MPNKSASNPTSIAKKLYEMLENRDLIEAMLALYSSIYSFWDISDLAIPVGKTELLTSMNGENTFFIRTPTIFDTML